MRRVCPTTSPTGRFYFSCLETKFVLYSLLKHELTLKSLCLAPAGLEFVILLLYLSKWLLLQSSPASINLSMQIRSSKKTCSRLPHYFPGCTTIPFKATRRQRNPLFSEICVSPNLCSDWHHKLLTRVGGLGLRQRQSILMTPKFKYLKFKYSLPLGVVVV